MWRGARTPKSAVVGAGGRAGAGEQVGTGGAGGQAGAGRAGAGDASVRWKLSVQRDSHPTFTYFQGHLFFFRNKFWGQ